MCVCFSFACVGRHDDSKHGGWQSGSSADPPSDPAAQLPLLVWPGINK